MAEKTHSIVRLPTDVTDLMTAVSGENGITKTQAVREALAIYRVVRRTAATNRNAERVFARVTHPGARRIVFWLSNDGADGLPVAHAEIDGVPVKIATHVVVAGDTAHLFFEFGDLFRAPVITGNDALLVQSRARVASFSWPPPDPSKGWRETREFSLIDSPEEASEPADSAEVEA